MSRLVVVSNRITLPSAGKTRAGGLAVGILAALKATGGLWYGWNGNINDDTGLTQQRGIDTEHHGGITYA